MIENRGVWSKDGTTGSLGKVALFYHRRACAQNKPTSGFMPMGFELKAERREPSGESNYRFLPERLRPE